MEQETIEYKGYDVMTINKKIACQSLKNDIYWIFTDYDESVKFMNQQYEDMICNERLDNTL